MAKRGKKRQKKWEDTSNPSEVSTSLSAADAPDKRLKHSQLEESSETEENDIGDDDFIEVRSRSSGRSRSNKKTTLAPTAAPIPRGSQESKPACADKHSNASLSKESIYSLEGAMEVENRSHDSVRVETTNTAVTPQTAASTSCPNTVIRSARIPPIVVNAPYHQLRAELAGIPGIVYQFAGAKVKLIISLVETRDRVLTLLKANRKEFFTHELRSEKPFKAVIRGLPDLPEEDIITALREQSIEPLVVHKISKKHYEGHSRQACLYLVHFTKGTITLAALKCIRTVDSIRVSWEAHRSGKGRIVQCHRCQAFGHGTRNCSMKKRCENCSEEHDSETCPTKAPEATKCANCNGSHRSTDPDCPSRHNYNLSRQKTSTITHRQPKPSGQPPPALTNANFPPLKHLGLPTPANAPNAYHNTAATTTAANTVPDVTTNPWLPRDRAVTESTTRATIMRTQPMNGSAMRAPSSHNFTAPADTLPGDEEGDFSIEEWVEILRIMTQRFRLCRNRYEKFAVIAELAIRYGC